MGWIRALTFAICVLQLYQSWEVDGRSVPRPRACSAPVDLAFIIDGSGSIEAYGKGNFRRCLNFVRTIVSRFNFNRGKTRIGVVLYSSRPRLIFDFRRYRRKYQILNAINRIRYPRGGTKTGYAMRYCYSRVFRYARRGVRKVAIVMTDGRSYDNVNSPAQLFRRTGIKCYAVGIGRKFNRRQLYQIAAGNRRHVLTAGFRNLGSIVNTIQRRACRGARPVRPRPRLPPGRACRARVDLAFVIDGSGSIEAYGKGNFRRCLSFVRAIVSRFSINNGLTRIGIVLYSSRPRLIFDFRRYRRKFQILNAINRIRYPRGGTKTGYAMRYCYSRVFRYARRGVRKVAIVMTDGRSYDNVNSPAQLFRRTGIKCYAVGIGRKFNRRQLYQIAAGNRRHVLTAGFRNLGSIVNTIQRRACRGTRPVRPRPRLPPGRGCRARVDLAFVIDGSGSIEAYGKGNFRRCLNFVRAIVSRFSINNGLTRIGIVLYSSRPRLIFDFRRYRRKYQILNAINRIRYPRGGTKTGYAMRYCYSRVFRYARRGVRKVAIVMTDGRSYDNVNSPAQLFRRTGIKCYAVGIGRRFNRRQLYQIAAGNRRHVLTAGFRNLGSIVNTIQRRACRGTRPVRPRPRLPPGRGCRARVDLAFIIDGSGSIEAYGKGNFRRCLNFVRAIVSRFSINNGLTRIGIVLYSSRPRLIFDFRRYRRKSQILNAINRIRYPRGGTKTGYAMRYCYSRVFRYARRGVRKVAIVMTDGRSYDNVNSPAQLFRRTGIKCYAVGIGRRFNRRQLNQIAAGNRRHVLTAGFRNLGSIVNTIQRRACRGTRPVRPRPRLPPGRGCRAQVDLAFVIDGSGSIEAYGKGNFRRCLNFVRAIVSRFSINNGLTRIGIVLYSSSPRLIFDFRRYRRKYQILNAINRIRYPRGGTKTGYAMRYCYSRVFRYARRGVRKVAIVMTDGRSYDNVNSPAQLFRRTGIKCYAVGIGRKFNRRQLYQIAAGNRRHVLTAGFRNLGSIVNTIQRRACRGTRPRLPPGRGRSICNLPKVTGPCRAAFRRWYFNRARRRCEMFIYGGCRGNANNFRSRRECEQKCLGKGVRPIRPRLPPGRGCRARVDLAFVIDGSGSIEAYGKGNFRRCLNFVRAIVSRFSINNGLTRIGIVLYSSRPRLIFDFRRYRRKHQILNAINRIRYPRGGTKTGYAMRYCYSRVFRYARRGVRKVAIVMTDGRSFDNVNSPAQLFRRTGIKCYAVGIGRRFNKRQLLQIAAGDRRHVLTAGFRNLGSIVNTIQRRACRGARPRPSGGGRRIRITANVVAISKGCYRDTGRRAIATLEGRSRLLKGSYRRRRYAIQKCALAAKRRGFVMFAIQHGGWCASTKYAYRTYGRYGKSNRCRNGKGGPWANDVYVLRGRCRKRTTQNFCCVFPFVYRGRRYNRCTRIGSRRPWCATTPNYDVDKLFGYCGSRVSRVRLTPSLRLQRLGCFKDTGRRAIPQLDGRSPLLRGNYKRRRKAIEKCAYVAKRRGYTVFGVQDGGWCASGRYAYRTFAKYGRSNRCRNGKGGPWANDVYRISGKCRKRTTSGHCCVFPFIYRRRRYYNCARTRRGRAWCPITPDYPKSRRWGYCKGRRAPARRVTSGVVMRSQGCYRDTGRRAIPQMDGRGLLVRGYYRKRYDAVMKCALEAAKRGYKCFAVQHGGWCATGPRAHVTYRRYGRYNKCRNGKGGPWANDVYFLSGRCRKRVTNGYCCRFPFIYKGRRYNSCTRTRHNRPWCALTPNFDKDKKWGNCAGGRPRPIRPVVPSSRGKVIRVTVGLLAKGLGCFRDTGRRAISTLEGRSRLLKGHYRRRRYAIKKCALAAKRRGYTVFAVQHQGWCASARYAYRTYARYGKSNRCRNGKGGPWANDVYVLRGNCRTRTTRSECCVFPFIYRGRRYTRCSTVNSRGRPWCAVTPNYDVDKLWGYCPGQGARNVRVTLSVTLQKVGCFRDTSRRAIPQLDGKSILLRGSYRHRKLAIRKCGLEAARRGYKFLGIQHGGWCASGPSAHRTFAKYGRSNRCRKGKGGPWANDVYRVTGKCRLKTTKGYCCSLPFVYRRRRYNSCARTRRGRTWCPITPDYNKNKLWGYCRGGKRPRPIRVTPNVIIKPVGCFRDTGRRAIPQMDGKDVLVRGYYRRRADAIYKCFAVAKRRGYRAFAVQHQGWCATGPRAHLTFRKYGRSNRCRNGKGGPWANDVYFISGKCRKRTTSRYCCAFPFRYKGRRYNSCISKNHNRPWCAVTHNFDRDKKWGNCAGRRPVKPVRPVIPSNRGKVVRISIGLIAKGLGCYRDTGRRAIRPLEGRSRLLRGSYRRRRYAIQKCGAAAQKRGYRVFAIQHGGWCASTKYAYRTYARYGKSNRCRRGKGGPWANDVYVLRGSCRKRTTRNNCCIFPFIYRGRRYNSCTRVNSRRPWCAITPNYDVDKLYGWCRRRARPIRVTPSLRVQRLGCFKDTSRRAIPQLDGKSRLLRGNYQRRRFAIEKCVLESAKRGYRVFGVQNGGWCASGPHAHKTYAKYGRSNRCRNGKGGPWANDVYLISGKCRKRTTQGNCCVFPFRYRRRVYNGCARNRRGQRWCALTPDYPRDKLWGYCRGGSRPAPFRISGVTIKSRGCFRDTGRRAIPQMDGRGILVRGFYRRRSDAIFKCALEAMRRNYKCFAVQHQGWCATGPRAHVTYRKYGRSNRCRNGKGGPWANDVYCISGSCRRRTTSRYCCAFPFIYKGRRYNSCTRTRHNRPWCALTPNYDRDKKWGNCARGRPVRPVRPVVPSSRGRKVRITTGVIAYGLGCYRDTGRRAISTLEGRSRLLKGSYRRRRYAINKCAGAALRRGYNVFAIQHGGWCASTKYAYRTYGRYGKSKRCRRGKGGPWANDVYVLRGSCRSRTTRNNCCVFPFVYRGRRYNSCTRVNSRRPWCALTPNYDQDKMYGWCRGRGVRPIRVTPWISLQKVGCFKDTGRRAIPQLDGRSILLRGSYRRRKMAIQKCALEAARRGYKYMGIQHGGWCASGPRAHRTYAKYGRSNRCRNGKGGPWANDVYRVSGRCRYRTTRGFCCVPFRLGRRRYHGCATNRRGQKWCAITPDYSRNKLWGYCRGGSKPRPIRVTTGVVAKSLGCYKDTGRRAVPQMDGRNPLVTGYYRKRVDAIVKCASVALRFGYKCYAVQHQGWCATGPKACATYKRYGRSNRCRNGKGGPWANDVYVLRGKCRKRTTSRYCCRFPFIYKGRRYNSCTRTRHNRPWCALTPNYDRDKKWGNCVRRRHRKPVKPVIRPVRAKVLQITANLKAYRIGCFRDTGRRAISTLEGRSRLLRGHYRRRKYAIRKCASAAKRRGYSVFAIQHGGWCASARYAYRTYGRYGKSNRCRNGKGGPWVNDVYVLRGSCRTRSSTGNCCIFPFIYRGRRYTSCTTANSRGRRPWCAITPNYDHDKLYGWCARRGVRPVKITKTITIQRMGCFKDTPRRAIPILEGRSKLIRGNYKRRKFAIRKCAMVAVNRGYKMFSVQDGGQCGTGPHAHRTFARYGRSNRCRNGKGGPWANDVYRVSGRCNQRTTSGKCCILPFVYRGRRYNKCAKTRRGRPWCPTGSNVYLRNQPWGYCRGGKRQPIRVTVGVRVKPLGCFKDTGRRAIPGVDGRYPIVKGYYRKRADAIQKCALVALRFGYKCFAVQHQGWCATGPHACRTYRKYGRTNRCRNGKGGPWANDVYRVYGSCRRRTTSRYCCAFPFIYKGRRYNSCTRKNHSRPWCAMTNNYDRDRKWGNCAGRRKPLKPIKPIVRPPRARVFKLTTGMIAYSIGCYKDTGRRAIRTLEGRSRFLKGHYRKRRDAIRKCFQAAFRRGYKMFALQHGGWCASSRMAHVTYRRYGKSNRCRRGKGGPWANDVYVLRGSCRVQTTRKNCCVFPFVYKRRRYASCTTVNSRGRRPWCATTSNYDADKMWGYCAGGVVSFIKVTPSVTVQRIGCFRDTGRRAIPQMDGKSALLRGNYQRRAFAIRKCALVAAARGHKAFGVQNGGWCATGPWAHRTFAKYGRSNRCRNGKGGPWANDVYRVSGTCKYRTTKGNCCTFPFVYRGRRYNSCARTRRGRTWCAITPDYKRNKLWGYCRGGGRKPPPVRLTTRVFAKPLGCFKDTGRRAIPGVDGRFPIVRGYYRRRRDAIQKCGAVAMRFGYRCFAVQHQGWCATGPKACATYRKYGRSNRCRNGKGGPWANDVYTVSGNCRKRTTSRYCCTFPFIYKGRRYNSCTRTRHNRPWCAITSNYDRDRKWGNCAGRRPVTPVRPVPPKGRTVRVTVGLIAKGIGCYRDTGRRAIAPLERRSRLLKGNYRRRRYAIKKCALAAYKRGYRMFAIQHGGWCAGSRRAHLTYRRYGKSNRCRNGKGGPWANDVYVLRGSCRTRSSTGNCCVFPFIYRRRRYNSCTRVRSKRPWCAITPNYDHDKLYGYCGGRKPVRPIRITTSITLQRIGCFKDTSRRAIPIIEGRNPFLRGNYKRRKLSIQKCALVAIKRGYTYMGVQDGGQCASGPYAYRTYAKYGRSNRCRNGKGGPWANDVYRIAGKCRQRTVQGNCCVFPFRYGGRTYRSCTARGSRLRRAWCATVPAYRKGQSWGYCRGKRSPAIRITSGVVVKPIGCFKDTGRRAIPGVDGRYPIVRGYYRKRADAIKKCAAVALMLRTRVFAIQHGGWCATGRRAHLTYGKYGRSNRCRNGKGGPWANDVYRVYGRCGAKTTTRYCCSLPFIYKGRRYNSCTRTRHNRPWCALTPNYDRDKKWANCAVRRPVRPVKPVVPPPRARVVQISIGLKAIPLGCFRDTGRRAISTLEGRSRLLKGHYRRRKFAIKKCGAAAKRRGYTVFAVQHGGWCASSRYAYRTYRKYGKSNRCRNGKGGPWANSVYVLKGSCRTRTTRNNCCVFPFVYRGKRYTRCSTVRSKGRPWCALTPSYDVDKLWGYCGGRGVRPMKITPSLRIQRIGCFKDTSRRAITQLDGKLPLLRGNYQRRKKAIAKCALSAARYGYVVFGVQHGGWCASGPHAHKTYAKYGRSNRCRNGKGGPWANDVYRVSGKCRLRTTTGYCCVPFRYRRRRYSGCATNRRGQKWCAITPDFHRNKLWGYCRGGHRPKPIRVTTGVIVKSRGCYRDTGRRAIPGVDGTDILLRDHYRRRADAIDKCALVTLRRGYQCFAVQHQGWCATGPKACRTYRRYGRSNRCRNGKGGPWANDVYFISGRCRRRTTSRYCCRFPFIYKGRRYNSCTKKNHNRPWCSLTGNYDRDKKWGTCVVRRLVRPVRPVRPPRRPRLPAGGVSHIPVTADIAFLIDGSRYVGRRNFHLEKAFIKSIAGRFTIGKHQSHIGVATYGGRAQLRMRFNQYRSLGMVLRGVNYIRYPNQGGRRVDLGLQSSLRYFFGRRNVYSFVRKILVVVVSGRQTGRSSYIIRRLPALFRRQGVLVFIVGVGRVDLRFLQPLTYKNRHVYVVRSYRSLVARAGSIARAIHQEMRIEQERYRDQLRRLNIDLGRHNSTDFEEEGERYKNGTTEPLLGAKNGTEVVNAL